MRMSRSPASSRAWRSALSMPSLTKWNVVPPCRSHGSRSCVRHARRPACGTAPPPASIARRRRTCACPSRSRRCARTSPRRCRCRALLAALAELQVLSGRTAAGRSTAGAPSIAAPSSPRDSARETVERHRHAEEHLPAHQSSTPFRTISATYAARLLRVCRPPSIAWYFSTASSRSPWLGTPCASRSGSPRRWARTSRLTRRRSGRRGLTVQQRDPLRRVDLGIGNPLLVVRPVRSVHHEVPLPADPELERPRAVVVNPSVPPPRQVPRPR